MTPEARSKILELVGGEKTYAEIASAVGATKGAVAGVLFRAKRQRPPKPYGTKLSDRIQLNMTHAMAQRVVARAARDGHGLSEELRLAVAAWVGPDIGRGD